MNSIFSPKMSLRFYNKSSICFLRNRLLQVATKLGLQVLELCLTGEGNRMYLLTRWEVEKLRMQTFLMDRKCDLQLQKEAFKPEAKKPVSSVQKADLWVVGRLPHILFNQYSTRRVLPTSKTSTITKTLDLLF